MRTAVFLVAALLIPVPTVLAQFIPGGTFAEARNSHESTLLGDGRIHITGGAEFLSSKTSAELYDSSAGESAAIAPMNAQRSLHTSTLLPNGRVLIVGGTEGLGTALSTAELFDPVAALGFCHEVKFGLSWIGQNIVAKHRFLLCKCLGANRSTRFDW